MRAGNGNVPRDRVWLHTKQPDIASQVSVSVRYSRPVCVQTLNLHAGTWHTYALRLYYRLPCQVSLADTCMIPYIDNS